MFEMLVITHNYFSHLSVTLIIRVHKGLKCLECLQLLRIILVNESTSAKLSRNRVDDYRENLCFKDDFYIFLASFLVVFQKINFLEGRNRVEKCPQNSRFCYAVKNVTH